MIRTTTLEQGLDLVTGDSEKHVDDGAAMVDGAAGNPSPGFDAMEVDAAGENDIWLGVGDQNSLLDLNDISVDLSDIDLNVFYGDYDHAPNLMGMHCMSSSSSVSPADASAGAAMVVPPLDPNNPDDINNLINSLSFVDPVNSNEVGWDLSTFFEPDYPAGSEQPPLPLPQPQTPPLAAEERNVLECFIEGDSELAGIFVEWLNNNRGKITTEDMKTIKLKRDTIDTATRRLGTDREGKKNLLRLILAWVENHQLEKNLDPNNPNPNHNIVYPSPSQVYLAPVDGAGIAYPTTFIPVTNQVVNGIPYVDPAQSWPVPQYNFNPSQQIPVVFGNPQQMNEQQMNEQNMERLTRLQVSSAATKEARKNRMIRQREMHARLRRSNQDLNDGAGEGGADGQNPGFQSWRQDHRCLRYMMQKVLKQSDVSTLGRIVLPKKEAEKHLPELSSGEGISLPLEDIGTSQIWNMRYRYWPNNQSRMYLLENTGDFVQAHGLQEGDFIVLYKDIRYRKYMIRGIKVRQPFLVPKKPAPKKNAPKKKGPKKNARNASGKGSTSASTSTSNVPIGSAA